MNQLEFVRGDTTFRLMSDGTLTARANGVEVQGSWSSKSEREDNVLTLTLPNREPLAVPVAYTFHTKMDGVGPSFQNVLRVEVPATEGGASAAALFGGKIVIDDTKDIEYHLPGGQVFFLYGNLSFSNAYDKLRITLSGTGGLAEIAGKPDLVNAHLPDNPKEADLLRFGALTIWQDGAAFGVEPATIALSGHISPENGKLRFFGSVKGEKTFDITLAGRYEAFGGGIRIWRDQEGETEAALTLVGALDFRGATGQFSISLGYSAKEKLSMTAMLAFADKRTDQEGNALLQGSAAIKASDGDVELELNLKGRFKISDNRLIAFEVDLEITDGKLVLSVGGTITVGKDKELSFKLVHSEGETTVELALKDAARNAWIKILAGDSGFSVSFSVTYTFASPDAREPTAGAPLPLPEAEPAHAAAATESGHVLAARATTPAPGATASIEITPESFPGYPRTSVGFFNSFKLLHPVMRRAVTRLQTRLHDEGIPLFVFESFRSPQRQNELFGQTPRVTNARAWESYHQYGVAVDFVFHEHGNWHWGRNQQHEQWYRRLHTLARELGLEPLSWETPHVQLAGLDLSDLQHGRYPAEGDSHWGLHLAEVTAAWNDGNNRPAAPPPPRAFSAVERPPLEILPEQPPAEGRRLILPEDVAAAASFHSRYGGIEWKVDVAGNAQGVIVKGRRTPERTDGEPVTCRKIVSLYGDLIARAAVRFDVPEELIIMTIATESAANRQDAFTGPRTFRWEPHLSEYSAGPMQTLSSTVRWLVEKYGLDYRPNEIAPRYGSKPTPVPQSHPLYEPELNIELGTLEIKERLGVTGFDPVLVAAAYNAGGLYDSETNRWHLRTYGDHLDRAARWFGDAFAI